MASKSEVKNVKKSIGKLCSQVGMNLKTASDGEKLNMVGALAMLSTATGLAETDTALARMIYSQARVIANLKDDNNDRRD